MGVVKSHRVLYADQATMPAILELELGERTSVFLIEPRARSAVASWYLRLRQSADRDPMWGLVRVEMRHEGRESPSEVTVRADEVSRWILAESAPTAHPDTRWDTMVYGIHDSEVFLKAIQ